MTEDSRSAPEGAARLGAARLSAALSDRYTIERELGAGGMATVYLAHDLKHDRKVAIKVLRPELAAVIGAERFLAEIKTTANLQHPHILPLFDSGIADSFLFYVMPYVEGISLRDRMSREKQLPINEAVRIATEVAAALDYAHRHGVIHRDIKPENILLHDGSALVADFGIALAASKAGTRMTETGMSLGTPQYMSPEQAMGERELDARSDVYALGCVTFEMLTGEPPFTGPTAQAIVAKVMTAEPAEITTLRKTVPAYVAEAVHGALQKLPADRFASAADFAAALGNPSATTVRLAVARPRQRARLAYEIGVAVLCLALAIALFLRPRGGTGGSIGAHDVVRATLRLGDSTTVGAINNARLAIAPDGKRIVFVSGNGDEAQLMLRDLDQTSARALPDTKGAFAPFFSPNGESIGFFTYSTGHTVLKVTPLVGGVARTVVEDSVASFGGGSWGDDGNIYFTNAQRSLSRVASSGGAATVLSRITDRRKVQEHDFPDILPGSKRAVVMLWKGAMADNAIGIIEVATGKVTEIAKGTYARFIPPGYLAIGTPEGRILVARFDPAAGQLLDTPTLMVQGVQVENSNGTVQFAANAATLAYLPESGGSGQLVWVARNGLRTAVDSTLTGAASSVALSPDATQIALTRSDGSGQHIWVKNLSTGALTRLSFDVAGSDRPAWSLDGRKVAFLGTRNGYHGAFVRRADAVDSVVPAVPGKVPADEIVYDPSGRYVILRTEGSNPGTRKLLALRIGVDTAPSVLIHERDDNFAVAISPDGDWLAYVSSESGQQEVYVRPFPNVDSTRFAISVGGGREPLWARNGTELYFRNSRGDMYAVPVTTGRHFTQGTPKLLFQGTGLTTQDYFRSYDVHPDGKRFLMMTSGGKNAPEINVIFNWQVELQKLGKGGK